MKVDVPIRCSCGTLRGLARGVSQRNGQRMVCYCDDCQAFAHFLGRADEILNAHAGTDVFSTTLAHIEITAGADQIACVRLEAGGMYRWYAACCRTPIGNTFPSPKSPFISVVHSCMDHASDVRSRDEALGPIRIRANGRFAKGDLSTLDAHLRIPLSMLPIVLKLFVAKLRGEYSPSPFFDNEKGDFLVTPQVLSEAELRRVRNPESTPGNVGGLDT